MISGKDTLLKAWDSTFDNEGWYPPLQLALARLSASEAGWKPAQNGLHSVWELVNHLLFYKERFLHRLKTLRFDQQVQNNDDTFITSQPLTEENWIGTVTKFGEVHRQIRLILEKLDESELDLPKPTETIRTQAWNLILHDAYHTGQIIDMRKLNGTWPATTTY